jgi:hypothetical protein
VAAGFLFWQQKTKELAQETIITTESAVIGGTETIGEEQNLPANTELTERTESVLVNLSEEEKTQGFLLKTAAAFAERFGSYSNQSNYENLLDLKMLMTEKMSQWADTLIAKGSDSQLIYYGITTRALNTELKTITEDQAEVLVATQRQEAMASEENNKVYYKDILIKFAKEDGLWKVDGAYWQ